MGFAGKPGMGVLPTWWTPAPERLDAACRRALSVDLIDVRRLERILVEALEQEATQPEPPPMPPGRFARPGAVFARANGRTAQSAQGERP